MAYIYQTGQTPTFLARITQSELDNANQLSPINPAQIESMNYSIIKESGTLGGGLPYAVAGHIGKEIPQTAVLESLMTNDPLWTIDSYGYNFKFTPNTRIDPAFTEAGSYRIIFTIRLTAGNPIVWSRTLIFE